MKPSDPYSDSTEGYFLQHFPCPSIPHASPTSARCVAISQLQQAQKLQEKEGTGGHSAAQKPPVCALMATHTSLMLQWVRRAPVTRPNTWHPVAWKSG